MSVSGKHARPAARAISAGGVLVAGLMAVVLALTTAGTASAAEVVHESSLGVTWFNSGPYGDTRTGGGTAFVDSVGAPLGVGALQLDTDASTTAKAQLMTPLHVGTPLADVTDLGYWTKRLIGPEHAAASYQLMIDIDGDLSTAGFTTLVYEPYHNKTVPAAWTEWDVDAGQFWSSQTAGGFTRGFGGAPFYTLEDAKRLAPNAVVTLIGVNIGSNNPGYTVQADALTFQGTTYDFEHGGSSKPDCLDGGWKAAGRTFKNQGDCISFYASDGATHPAG